MKDFVKCNFELDDEIYSSCLVGGVWSLDTLQGPTVASKQPKVLQTYEIKVIKRSIHLLSTHLRH